jgi:hypothetical protein
MPHLNFLGFGFNQVKQLAVPWLQRVKRRKAWRSAHFAKEKLRADWNKGLQICGAGAKSQKVQRWSLVVGRKPYGNSRLK